MAQRVVTILVDDLDETELPPGEGETITFGLDGSTYEIDLGDANAAALREALERYVDAARKAGEPKRARRGRGSRAGRTAAPAPAREYAAREVRQWAKDHDISVPDRGRIPQSVLVQFQEAAG